MTDLQYADDALVDLYDRLNTDDADTRFFLSRLNSPPGRMVDLGSGTGTLALTLAAKGYEVTGIDPSPAMMAHAKRKDVGASVCWIDGAASDIPTSIEADGILMAGHAFQCLLDDNDIQRTLQRVRAALAPGGRFMFDSRNPLMCPWEQWTPKNSVTHVHDRHGLPVSVFHSLLWVCDDRVGFETTYLWPDHAKRSQSTLRFLPKKAIQRKLHNAGFTIIECFGDWDGSPYGDDSPKILVVAG